MPVEVVVADRNIEHRSIEPGTSIEFREVKIGGLFVHASNRLLGMKILDGYYAILSDKLAPSANAYIGMANDTLVHPLKTGDAVTLVVR